MDDRDDRDDRTGNVPPPKSRASLSQLGFTAKIAVITALLLYILAPLMVVILLGVRIGNLVPFWVIGVIALVLLVIFTVLGYLTDDTVSSYGVSLLEHPRQALQLSLIGATFVLLIAFGYYALSHIIATEMPLVFQCFIFLVLGGVAFVLGVAASTSRGRQWISEKWPMSPNPYLYPGLLVTLIVLMTSLFGGASFTLQRLEVIHLYMANGTQPTIDTHMAFYIWHFFDTLPLLDVTKTLHWVAPVKYYDRPAGALLILYTIAVIIPVIALFVQMTKAVSGPTSNKQ